HHRPTAALANRYCLKRELGSGQICSRNSGDHPDLDVTELRWDTPLPRLSELDAGQLRQQVHAVGCAVELNDAIAGWRAAVSGRSHRCSGTIPVMDQLYLPGQDLIEVGLRDLARGAHTEAALLVSLGAPRLRQLGYAVPTPLDHPEQALYALLARQDPATAHGRYNALVRRLVSFERAAACAS
ncbi:MAG TPA: hypothetical protein VNL18_10015, partial [Gemmatimonadales bacterium]|nr:hypothetical protein [Gemmatimonadales bacterium]